MLPKRRRKRVSHRTLCNLYASVAASPVFQVLPGDFRRQVTLIFLRDYPAENVAMDGRLQSENPKILEALKKIGA
jgi:hypothetical protein